MRLDEPRTPWIAVIYRPIEALKSDPRNPRAHSKKQVGRIAASITELGFAVPVLVDAELNVIAGHARLLASRQLGLTEVPTISLDHLSEAQARAFAIADNRLAEIATWDDRLLAEQLRELSVVGLDLDIEITGFEMGEIDLRIGALDEAPEADDPDDAVPEASPGLPVTRPGDLWLLGPHRVLCASALDLTAFRTLMGEESAVMVFCDPPYNVPIDGHATGLGRVRHRPFAMASGEMTRPAFGAFLATALGHHAAFCNRGALLYVCMDWRHIDELLCAERTGRRCCGIELDPAYVDTMIRRWQSQSGGSAHHAGSGRSFDELAREVEVTDAV